MKRIPATPQPARTSAAARRKFAPRATFQLAAGLALTALAAARADSPSPNLAPSLPPPTWTPGGGSQSSQPLGDLSGGTVPAVTKPSASPSLHFEVPGVVAEVFVKEGQVVKKGDKLAQEDDRQEKAELDALELDANSTADVTSAEALVDSSKAAADAARGVVKTKGLELDRLKEIAKNGGGNALELEKAESELYTSEREVAKAEADVRKSQADVLRAQRDLSIKKAKALKQRIHVENMTLRSPIDGLVERIDTKPGEMALADPSKGSFRLVSNSPLWVEVNLSIPQAQALLQKDVKTLKVSHDGQTWDEATILWHAPVADAPAGMQKLTLQLDNPQGRSSGLNVRVQLPKEISVAREASAR